jgi:cell division protein FtsB
MSKLKKKKLRFYIFLILFLIGLAFILFNEYGLLKYQNLKSDVKSLNEQISNTEKENKALEGEIDSLQKKIPAKIEVTAREKYNMLRKGEKDIQVKEK